jgi:hypothetical protein
MLGAWIVLAAVERSSEARARPRARTMGALVVGLAATAAVAVAWRIDDTEPILAGGAEQVALATWQAHPRATLVEAGRGLPHRTGPAEARAHLILTATRVERGGRLWRLELPPIPPGRYRVSHLGPIPAAFALGVGRSGLDWRRLASGTIPETLELDVPVALPAFTAWPLDAPALVNAARPRTLMLEPLGPHASATGEGDVARQVVRYGAHDVFFLDERSYPEKPGFWVPPGAARVVVGETAGSFAVVVRNTPVANRVELIAGPWRRALDLTPGEEVRVEIPASGAATPVEIRAARGVRPFDGDRRNRDVRLLGVWIALE